MDETTPRDDAVLAAMRVVALVVVAVLLPALVILWGLPGDTADLWAWTIKPDLTPIFMGAGYGAGAYFFTRVYLTRRWHEVSVGVVSAAAFALLMLVATLIHYDKFNHGDAPTLAVIAFYGWVGVYILSPWLVGALWWLNQRRDPRVPDEGETLVPANVRLVARVIAIGALLAAAVLFISPGIAIDNVDAGYAAAAAPSETSGWAWQLTPLTARVLACFTAQVGIGFLLLSFDSRWSSWRVLVQTFLIAVALLLVGAARAWSDFYEDNIVTWAYLAGLAGGALALLALYRSMQRAHSSVSR